MESIGKECTPLKKEYDSCFQEWYTNDFLKGTSKTKVPCEELFKRYQSCLEVVLKEKGIDKSLEEVRTPEFVKESNKSNN
jgi:TRIAP1/MDM35 family protein